MERKILQIMPAPKGIMVRHKYKSTTKIYPVIALSLEEETDKDEGYYWQGVNMLILRDDGFIDNARSRDFDGLVFADDF